MLDPSLPSFSIFIEYELFSGTLAEVSQQLDVVLSAAEFISNQNINYHAFGIFEEGTNSNSVANSLVVAMGLALPSMFEVLGELVSLEEFQGFAPGFERNFIPTGFEALAGNAYRLTGGSNSDMLIGGSGDDELNGAFGVDMLIGRAGNNLLAHSRTPCSRRGR